MINKKNNIYNIMLIIFKIFKRMPLLTFLTFVIPFIGGMITFFTYTTQVEIINIIVSNVGEESWRGILSKAAHPLIIFTSIYAVQAISKALTNIFKNVMNSKVTLFFKSEIVDIMNKVSYEKFDEKEFCDKLERAKSVVGEHLVGIMQNLVLSISISSSLLSIIWLAATSGYFIIVIVVVVMMALSLWLKLSTEMKVRKVGRELTFDGRMGDYLSNKLEESNTIREMKIYNASNYFIELWGGIITKQHRKRYDARRDEIKIGMIVTLIQTIAIFLVLLMLLNRINSFSKVTIGTISVLFMAMLSSGYKIMSLTWPLSKLYISSTKLYDLNEILKMKESFREENKIEDKKKERLLPIELNSVSFKYLSSNKKIINDLNLKINKGEKIAIVGENGAGKSTLVKLILGQYKPSEGEVLWNGINKISSNPAVVFQNFIKFQLTLRENIALGNIEEYHNDEKIIETLKKCDLYDLYKELGSLDVTLGRIKDGGRQLSGGQWQKLAIARAVFNDADLLVFDEPTSAIDPNAELEIFNRLMKICKDKTAVFISHRFGWAKNADKIIVMDKGKIIEMGSHEELIELKGTYNNMYKLQSSWYI
ncbi:ABC transporter ATP-binding protein [Oceanirhabdus sp. W0125-5]|uniref:ABC transporter ATP-binding protein n=1 Tax=Oceanirhabdus sp. W0125-5 TaxID=2999116 RepID=UPI0022F30C97|nr:ABC transporter ATP-binding protein [Oceanirhabdus sp. W0125-5]WBW94723.1 ABC transporter ATP-binding protein [Oceanirhabdus sp. W0125-5]